MGFLRRRYEEVRSSASWLSDEADEEAWFGKKTAAGVRVNTRVALSLTTIWRCVDLLSSAVALAPKDIVIRIGQRSFPEYSNLPGWLEAPNPLDPTYTIDDYFSQVAISILTDGNYFTFAYPYVWDAQALIVLNPAQVEVKDGEGAPVWVVKDQRGKEIYRLGPMQILHGVWLRPPGELRGISPIEALRRGIGSAIAAEEHGARFFGQGASLSFGVEVPGELDANQKAGLSESLRKKYGGLQNSHAIGLLTGGAKFVPGLAPTPEQAQMLESRQFSVEDLCRPYGVPPGLVGSTQAGESFASSEVDDRQFKERAVLPLAGRIERQHNRLVAVPGNITAPGARAQFRLNLDWITRVTLKERYEAYREGVEGGFLMPAEAREKEDLPPVAGADRLYMQAQMTPVDQLGQPTGPTGGQ